MTRALENPRYASTSRQDATSWHSPETTAKPTLLALAALLVASALLGLITGAVDIPLAALWQPDQNLTALQQSILTELRLPRVVLATLVGATLAVSGTALQGLFRNPLAEPQLIGVSAGAALGAVAMIVLGSTLSLLPQALSPYSVPLGAIAGALVVTSALYALTLRSSIGSVSDMLLLGIAINALAGVGIGVFTWLANDGELRSLTFWSMGSFGGAQWQSVVPAGALMLAGLLTLIPTGNNLDRLQLGERAAHHLGIAVHPLKQRLIFGTAIGVGAAVSITGMIGFLGLVVPHIARLLVGVHQRPLMWASLWLGGTLAVIADIAARTLAAPAEVPVGLLTSAIGAPLFLWLVLRRK